MMVVGMPACLSIDSNMIRHTYNFILHNNNNNNSDSSSSSNNKSNDIEFHECYHDATILIMMAETENIESKKKKNENWQLDMVFVSKKFQENSISVLNFVVFFYLKGFCDCQHNKGRGGR